MSLVKALSFAPACLAVSLAVLTPAAPAGAQADDRLTWDDTWSRAHPIAYTVAGVGGGLTLILDNVLPFGAEPQWRGPILGDRAITDALAPESFEQREAAAKVSDLMLLLGGVVQPLLIDAWGVVGLGDTNSDVAWQLTAIAIETLTAAYLLNTLVKRLVDRERPLAEGCTEVDHRLRATHCGSGGTRRSFYSGHATGAFAAAGMVCMNHAYLRIYGSEAADAFGCGLAMVNATTVAILRIMARRHWASDVIVGGLVGLAVGLLVPWGLHYGLRPAGVTEMRTDMLTASAGLRGPIVIPVGGGTF